MSDRKQYDDEKNTAKTNEQRTVYLEGYVVVRKDAFYRRKSRRTHQGDNGKHDSSREE